MVAHPPYGYFSGEKYDEWSCKADRELKRSILDIYLEYCKNLSARSERESRQDTIVPLLMVSFLVFRVVNVWASFTKCLLSKLTWSIFCCSDNCAR